MDRSGVSAVGEAAPPTSIEGRQPRGLAAMMSQAAAHAASVPGAQAASATAAAAMAAMASAGASYSAAGAARLHRLSAPQAVDYQVRAAAAPRRV